MRGYLLDTNHLGAYHHRDPRIIEKMRSVPVDWQVRVCTVTLGEVEAGHLLNLSTDEEKRNDFKRFLNEHFLHNALEISINTRLYYAKVIASIWQLHPPPGKKTRTEAHLVNMGVDINDVWICASAWEHNLTLVTEDYMKPIKDAVGSNVRFECWL